MYIQRATLRGFFDGERRRGGGHNASRIEKGGEIFCTPGCPNGLIIIGGAPDPLWGLSAGMAGLSTCREFSELQMARELWEQVSSTWAHARKVQTKGAWASRPLGSESGRDAHAPVKMRPFHLARLGLDRRQLSEFFGSFRMGETGNFSSWWDLSGVTVQESFFSAFRQTPVAWSATMFFIEDKEVGSTLMV